MALVDGRAIPRFWWLVGKLAAPSTPSRYYFLIRTAEPRNVFYSILCHDFSYTYGHAFLPPEGSIRVPKLLKSCETFVVHLRSYRIIARSDPWLAPSCIRRAAVIFTAGLQLAHGSGYVIEYGPFYKSQWSWMCSLFILTALMKKSHTEFSISSVNF